MLIDFLSVFSAFMGLLFGFFALFSDVRDKHGRITRLAIGIGSGIFLTGLLSLIVGSMQNKMASSEKEREIKMILRQIYTENSRLTPQDIELRMDYVCRIESEGDGNYPAESAGTVFQMPGWNLMIELQADSKTGTLTTSATEVLNPRTRYHSGGEHWGGVEAKAMRFVDFELGNANDFLYPSTWNNASIRIDFDGTDRSIFSTTFVGQVGGKSLMALQTRGADHYKVEYNSDSLCDFDSRDFFERVKSNLGKLDVDTSGSSTQYLAVLPAQFDIELKIKGIVVGKTSGYIYQIRDEVAFRWGNEKTGAFFPMIKAGGDLFPDIELKPDAPVNVVATVGYPSLTIAIMVGLLCMVLALWVILKRIIGDKN